MLPEEVLSLMKTVDLDGSGELDVDEFCVMLTGHKADGSKYGMPAGMEGSAQGSERVSAQQMAVATYTANLSFEELDANNDGVIDEEEFKKMQEGAQVPALVRCCIISLLSCGMGVRLMSVVSSLITSLIWIR